MSKTSIPLFAAMKTATICHLDINQNVESLSKAFLLNSGQHNTFAGQCQFEFGAWCMVYECGAFLSDELPI